MIANTYCDFIPGGQDLPLIDARSEEAYYADSPLASDIAGLLDEHAATAVSDASEFEFTDKDLLAENTKALNVFIYSEMIRVNDEIDDIVAGLGSKGSTFPSNLEDLYDLNAVYNADTTDSKKGLTIPANKTNTPFKNLYPSLSNRLDLKTGLTTAETHYFIKTNLYDPATFTAEYTEPGNLKTLHALEDFYKYGNFSQTAMGAFCALVPDIFAAVNEIKDAIADVRSYANQVVKFFQEGFAGFEFKLTEQMAKQMIDNLKQHVLTMVDQMVETALNKLDNLTGGFITATGFHTDAIVSKVLKEKEKAQQFFSKENIKKIKEKITGAINYASGVFERMDLEEIQFLILRFCEFMTNLEKMFYGRPAGISTMVQQYEMAKEVLSGSGNVATARAIQAGAIRYAPENISEIRGRMSSMGASGPISDSPNAAPGSRFAEVRAVPAMVSPMTQEEMNQIPTFEEIMSGNQYFYFPQGLGGMGSAGWTGLMIPEKIMLLRIAKLIGNRVSINSAYRSPSYNASVGGATNSMHKAGKAIDVWQHAGMSQESFINIARETGFTGIGRYSSFTHVDTGATRSWSA